MTLAPFRLPRRAHALAGLAALTVASAALAGCSSTTKSAVQGAPLPGITASSVKVGFTIVDLGSLSKSLGFKQADYGGVPGQTAAINAVVAYINKNGGMGGRQVTADVKTYLGATDSPAQSQAQCNAYTQDDKVFGIVMTGQLQTNAQPCYDAARTIVLDETLVAHDQKQFEQNSPYLWSPTHPEYGAFVKAQLGAMNSANYFAGNTGVLLMPSDDEVSRRVTDTIVKPYLASIGITKVQASYIDSSTTGSLGATSSAALIAGRNGKLNRVVVVGGARIAPVALADQNANNYASVWGVSTFDNPTFLQQNPATIVTQLREGMVGLGYAPDQDIVGNDGGPAFPDPANQYQKRCYDIITQAGATPPGDLRSNWTAALQFCDGAMFMKAVLDKVPGTASVTGAQFVDAAGKIGGAYGSSMTFGSSWGPGVFAGTNAGQALSWDEPGQRYVYTGGLVTFGPGAGSGTAPTTSAPGAPDASVPLETITVAPQ